MDPSPGTTSALTVCLANKGGFPVSARQQPKSAIRLIACLMKLDDEISKSLRLGHHRIMPGAQQLAIRKTHLPGPFSVRNEVSIGCPDIGAPKPGGGI